MASGNRKVARSLTFLLLSAGCLVCCLLGRSAWAQSYKKKKDPHHHHKHDLRRDGPGPEHGHGHHHHHHAHGHRAHRTHAPLAGQAAGAAGWADAALQGWNRGEVLVGGIRRIPLDGLRSVGRDAAPGPNLERADRRAVVLVPRGLDADRPVEVLLHLHGYHNGYRQELTGTKADPIRDRDVDRIEDQMEESGRRQLIAILPQGSGYSDFAPAGSHGDKTFIAGDLIDEVLQRLAGLPGLPAGGRLQVGRLIVSAHSGGGEPLGIMLEHEQLPKETLAAVALFDAINGPREELPRIEHWLQQHLDQDLAALRDADEDEQRRYLATSLRFRAYHTPGGHYGPLHDDPGARFADPLLQPVQQFLDAWFHAHDEDLGGADSVAARGLRDNYRVIPVPGTSHDGMMGTGILRDVLRALPADGPEDQGRVATTRD